jgi:hypothetical protein
MDFVPEIPAGLRIDACGWLVEKEELWPMDKTGCEGKALFPTTGKLAGQLFFTSLKPETF